MNLSMERPVQFYYDDFVECYYPKGVETPLYIYSDCKGDVIDTLYERSRFNWYKMAINDSRPNNWFRLEGLIAMPDNPVEDFPQYKNAWVHSDQLQLFVPDIGSGMIVTFFQDHNDKAQVVFKTKKYMKTTLVEIWEDWAKVRFETKNGLQEGWLLRRDQCAAPWTNCTLAGQVDE